MARPIWKGNITFGLVNIPVTLYSAEERFDLHFNLLDRRNKARIKYEKVNEVTGKEVPWEDVIKAYEYEEGQFVEVTDEDFRRAAVEATQTVEIEDFVDRNKIDCVYYDKPYYLVPGKKGEKGYVLLRETLKRANQVGIAHVVIRTKQYLSAVVAEDEALVLEILRYAQELKDPAKLELPRGSLKDYGIAPREVEMAERLVEAMAAEWKPEKYHDEYHDKLIQWIEKKAREGETALPPEPAHAAAPQAAVVDMMDLLKKSLEQSGRKGEAQPAASQSQAKAKAKRRAAEPAAARRKLTREAAEKHPARRRRAA